MNHQLIALTTVMAPLAGFAIALLGFRRRHGAASLIVLASGVVAAVGAGLLLFDGPVDGTVFGARWFTIGDHDLEFGVLLDGRTRIMAAVVALITLCIEVYSLSYMAHDAGRARFFAFLAMFEWSMLLFVMASNLLQMFIFWELVGLASFLLIGFWYEKPSAVAAAKKAFIMTRIGDIGLFIGLILLFRSAGTLDVVGITQIFAADGLPQSIAPGRIELIATLFFIGVIGKSAQFPLHTWLPDAMEGPTPVSALLHSATMVAAGVFLVARFHELFTDAPSTMNLMLMIATFTALLSSTMAMTARDMKRVLAFSSISQLGFMLMGLAAGSLFAGFFHLTTHAFFKALLFLCAGAYIHQLGTNDMVAMGRAGAAKKMRLTTICLVVGGAALAGLPPLAGFFSKEQVIGSLHGTEHLVFRIGAYAAAFLTAYYTFRMVFLILRPDADSPATEDEPAGAQHAGGHGDDHGPAEPWPIAVPLVVLALGALGVGFLGDRVGRMLRIEHLHHPTIPEMAPAIVIALAGVALAWLDFGRRGSRQVGFIARVPAVKTLFENRWYVDAVYRAVFVRLAVGIARLCFGVETRGLDGGADKLGAGTVAAGRGTARAHSGRLQLYIGTAVVLVAAVVFYLGRESRERVTDFMADFPIITATLLCPVAALVATLLIPSRHGLTIKVVNAVCGLASVALAIAAWALYDRGAGGFQMLEDVPWVPTFGIRYTVAVDGAGVVLNLLTAVVFFTGVLSMWGLANRVKEYFAFMAALVFGVFGVFSSLDIVAFFFFYEVAVLPMYPLIAIWGSTRKEYSAMKLTLYLMAGSALLFPGLIALYMYGGIDSWNITELAARGGFSRETQIFLYPFLYIGFGVLAGMFPFHGWSPTGHVAAPTAVSMLHAGVLMKLGAFGIFRIAMSILPAGAAYWAPTFAVLATIGIVYGAFVAMRQNDFKYVIGFSSVSHMGIVLLGLNVWAAAGDASQAALDGAIFQMFAHGIMTALFFSSVGFIYDQTHDRDIRNFGGLVSQVPLAASFFIVAAMCGMGVPGFASFWAELLVFIAAIRTYPVLGIVAIAGLVFTAAYVLRVFGKAMFGPRNPEWEKLVDVRAWSVAIWPRAILVGVLLLFGFYPGLMLDMIRCAVRGGLQAMGNLLLFVPEATVLIGALVALALSVFGTSYRANWMVSVAMAAVAVAVSIAWLGAEGEPFFPEIYRVDAFSQVLKVAITTGLLLSTLIAGHPGSVRERSRVDFPLFLYFSAVGMMMMVSATELVTLYVALELSAYGLYILAALSTRQREGSEAAAKYVLFGAASSAVTLFGISLLFGATGTTLLSAIIAAPPTPLIVVGVLLALAGVLFKLAVVPFHAWAPDTYEGAPHEAVTFIGTASKVAAVGVIARLLLLAMPAHAGLVNVLLILCVASMTIGNLAAIVQRDLKRLLGYSTVAHAGYILMGFVCFSEMGVASAIYYAAIYVPIVFCAMLVVCVLGTDGANPTTRSIAGLYRRSPLLAVTLLVGMFGLAGIPPTAGFFGKWFLFSAALEADLLWLVVVGAINATVSLYYYLRIIKEAYLTPPADDTVIKVTPATAIAAGLGVGLVLFFGFYPRPLWELAEAAAKVFG